MKQLCDIQIHVDGQQTFLLNQRIMSKYSGRLKKIIREEKRRVQIKNSCIEINGFPGGAEGFEMVSRFCYNNGRIRITVSNVSLLHCCSIFLVMTEKVSASCNLLEQTESFLEGMLYWPWHDVITSLKSCESFIQYAESCGLIQKHICALLAKIAQNSDLSLIASSSSSSSTSSPKTENETPTWFRFSSSKTNTLESTKLCTSPSKEWWFDDLTILPPKIIEKIIQTLGAYGAKNNSLVLTRFLLRYLKSSTMNSNDAHEYSGLADTAVHGVILVGKPSFSCRRLFWVLSMVSSFGLSRDCRGGLERMIGGMLDQATLDDLLVAGGDHRGIYDVNLVVRLIRTFVNTKMVSAQKMKKVGKLIDKYLGEISPDHDLKISKFLGVAEGLPDSARDCFDGVYRAVDIYLESHPTISFKERSNLCRCINYKKLTLEACKDLAKNPRIPPNVAVEALMSQRAKIATNNNDEFPNTDTQIVSNTESDKYSSEENGSMKLNLQRMQWRVVELEKVCKEMKRQMLRLVRHDNVLSSPAQSRTLPRLC